MADPTLAPDRWHTYLTWWRFWGVIGFCLTFFLSFVIISDMEGVPAYCGWRHPCPPWILLPLGLLPIYAWAFAGLVAWGLGRIALRSRRTPAWGIVVATPVFLGGVIFSIYMVADYWWPNA